MGRKLRLVRLKKLNRKDLNELVESRKNFRLRESLKLLNNPDNSDAKIEVRRLTGIIGDLKQAREKLPHPKHKFLVVSASRRGPMLYAFCREKGCRHRVFKSLSITVPGSAIGNGLGDRGECTHPTVSLRRGKHFDVSAVCLTCGQSTTLRDVFVRSTIVLQPKIDWPNLGRLGDSMLPKGDPRLLP